MNLFKVPTLAVLLQVWTLLGAAAPPQLSNTNSPSLNLVGPNITPTYDSTLRNESRVLNASNVRYPDPYNFRQRTFTIEFYGYRNPNTVPLDDLNGCYHQAKEMASSKVMDGQGGVPVGTNPQSWSSGNVYLRIEPGEQITWRDWSSVLIFLRLFVYNNEFKGMQFLILKDGLGPIGTGSILREPEDKSVATNTSVTARTDPYDMRFPGMTIEFYGYRGSVSQAGLEGCVAAAYGDIQLHVSSGQTNMTAPSYSYSVGTANLFLAPGAHLTWMAWFDVPLRIQGFVMDNGLRETQFILLSDEFGPIGHGQLVSLTGAPTDVA